MYLVLIRMDGTGIFFCHELRARRLFLCDYEMTTVPHRFQVSSIRLVYYLRILWKKFETIA